MIFRASSQISIADTSKGLQQWVSAPSLVLFVVVCLVILLIVSSSHSDAGGQKSGFKVDDHKFQAKNSTEDLKKGSQATTLIESIFSDHLNSHSEHLNPHPDDEGRNEDATSGTSHAQNAYEEEQDKSFENEQADEIEEDGFCSSPTQTTREVTSLKPSYESGGFGKVKKLSRPATCTSTGMLERDHFRIAVDAKMTPSPHSFKEDASQEEKDDLNEKFDAFLNNFRQQLKYQKMESLLRRQKDSDFTGEDNAETSLERNVHPLPNVLLEEDEDGEELSVEELDERVDKFVSNFRESFASQQQEGYPSSQQTHTTTDNGLSSSADAAKAPSQLSRRDSLAVDNQKFDAFLHNFRNDLKLQKQQSILRRQDR
ncbi:hypothetical protein O6H91_18G023600 [Diphasiastrum complanatum]|nr:hypothetical protein O6H91_18G023600 [Diphasiastrum complanatum]